MQGWEAYLTVRSADLCVAVSGHATRAYLQTLDYRDRISGIGEMIKYSITYDPSFFESLSKRWPDIINLESSVLEKAVSKCVQWKARVVRKDPFETKGFREILNFGHTLGHALETAVKYQGIRHGEAVIFGMRAASLLSVYQSHLSKKTLTKLKVPWRRFRR